MKKFIHHCLKKLPFSDRFQTFIPDTNKRSS
jgi:hypothetical protein